jgi:tyrosinase
MDVITLASRREFLKGLGAASAVSLLTLTGGCDQLIDIIEHRPVRRDISKLTANDPIIQTYQAAVTAMKGLGSSDGRNWTNQALIHFNHCPHGNWYFLPWHRAYLLAFEQICRQLTGNNDFALPYWNWTANPSVPAVF